jgi:hypothetical protein
MYDKNIGYNEKEWRQINKEEIYRADLTKKLMTNIG